jgi:hypothetical protein
MLSLKDLVAKSTKADILHELIGFAPERLMDRGRRATGADMAFWNRAERLTALRRDEHWQMHVSLPFGEHMSFLVGALVGDPSVVTEPTLPPLPQTADNELVNAAVEFLRRTSLPIEPRKKCPDGECPSTASRDSLHPPTGRVPQSSMRLGRSRLGWLGSTLQMPRPPLFR